MRYFALVVLTLVINACAAVPAEQYATRGQPEALLDVSSERVTFSLSSDRAVDELAEWINNDQPSKAILKCIAGHNNPLCVEVELVLTQYGVPFSVETAEGKINNIELFYDRVVLRECSPKYVNNSYNPDNLNHQNFGCSVASNMVQSLEDHRQLLTPAFKDPHDAASAIEAYERYQDGGL
jgi:hypothetical protein